MYIYSRAKKSRQTVHCWILTVKLICVCACVLFYHPTHKEVEEETDDEKLDIESCFPVVSQEVADHGDTDIITPPGVKTYEGNER